MNEKTVLMPNPYVGPRAFKYGEELFGRDKEISELRSLLIANRIVLLYSPSGAGKSSLIQAGLIGELEKEEFQVLPVMRVSLAPPPELEANNNLNRHVLSLMLSIEDSLPPEQQKPYNDLVNVSFKEYVERRTTVQGRANGVVLIFDQFEEILTVHPSAGKAKERFFTEIGQTLQDDNIWALFAMREEYLAGLDRYLRQVPTHLKSHYRLELLREPAARKAIQKPASRSGVEFADDAATSLIDDLRQITIQNPDGTSERQLGDYIEPVQLQVVCKRLWNQLTEDQKSIDLASVKELKDVNTALADYYAECVAKVAAESGANERTIREWFDKQLITEYGIRGQVLQEPNATRGLDNSAIWPLVDAHLVRAEKRRGATWFELSHDRLIDPVRDNNASWRETHLSLLQRQAALWDDAHRPDGMLLSGEALVSAERESEKHLGDLTETEDEFLSASRNARARKAREARRNLAIRVLSVVVFISFLGMSWYAYNLFVEARPWGALHNLASGKVSELSGDSVSIGRSTETIHNGINLNYRNISRIHLRIDRNLNAVDMRSLLGTTINGQPLVYGDSEKVKDGDIIVLAGIAPFRFQQIQYPWYQLWKPSFSKKKEPEAWGMVIGDRARAIKYLSLDTYYLALTDNNAIQILESQQDDNPVKIVIRRHVDTDAWVYDDGQGDTETIKLVTIQDQDDDYWLFAVLKIGDYTYKQCYITPGKEYYQYQWEDMDCQEIMGRRDFREDEMKFHSVFSPTYYIVSKSDPKNGIPFQIVPVLKGLDAESEMESSR